MAGGGEELFMARERHLDCLHRAQEHLDFAAGMEEDDFCMMELLAEELRLAGRELSDLLGETTSEDLLGMIFSRFCIGK